MSDLGQQETEDLKELAPGYIQFYDNGLPMLDAGEYTITVTHDLKDDAGRSIDTFRHNRGFTVEGPRFTLSPSDVHSVYPPVNGRGKFQDSLPHIVLGKRTFPWERKLGGAGTDEFRPTWVALLLFNDGKDELVTPGDTTPTRARRMKVEEIVNPGDTKVRGPVLTGLALDERAQECLAIDVKAEVFKAIAPLRSELPYLAHVRQVNTEDKEIQGVGKDGWFSVVLSNRLPSPGARFIAHLVSLEGHSDFLPRDENDGDTKGFNKVRLVSLASWCFICDESTGDFSTLMKNIGQNSSGLAIKIDRSLDGGTTPPAIPAAALNFVKEAFERGYMPLDHTTRYGEKTVSWYRGPLAPVGTERNFSAKPYETADEAIIYDPERAMFDLSFAAAWQLGKLLALSDRSFCAHLLNWRRRGHQMIKLLESRLDLFKDYYEVLDAAGVASKLFQVQSVKEMSLPEATGGNLISLLFAGYLKEELARKVTQSEEGGEPLIKVADPTGLLEHMNRLPGLVSPDRLNKQLTESPELDPAEALYSLALARTRDGEQG